ncbi:MAG: phosphoglucosamine mutase, partial [Acidimicrobiia bacterium]|nr:phosphoglucosamine mutase [Acidimicrobiia bacterium]
MRFGTDGIRGVANVDITPEVALALGRAAAVVLGSTIAVGRDTRRSGGMLESAFAAGVTSAGVDVIRMGIAPTPAVAWVAADRKIAGAVISASHNPWTDNGIKLFATGGRKLDDATERAVESALLSPPPTGPAGSISLGPQLVDRWADALVASLRGRRLDGLSVVVDCANGAAAWVAADVLSAAGASVHA